jgi:hypothetical protein
MGHIWLAHIVLGRQPTKKTRDGGSHGHGQRRCWQQEETGRQVREDHGGAAHSFWGHRGGKLIGAKLSAETQWRRRSSSTSGHRRGGGVSEVVGKHRGVMAELVDVQVALNGARSRLPMWRP